MPPATPTGQPPSPSGSGRSSPASRLPRRPLEDGLQKKDKGYRRYAAGIERALALFDTAQQVWADYISFLGRLLKAIQAHPPGVDSLPHSNDIATRLAQCLDPSLPAGVHLKSVEVYSYIFSLIGAEGLSRDLYLYLPGLSPVLSFASISLRPSFLALIEKHISPLNLYALRPALRSIILSLLPGLEDEASDDFDRILQLLDFFRTRLMKEDDSKLSVAVSGEAFFWQCFFLSTITNPSRRQGALSYLTRKLPKLVVDRKSSISIHNDKGEPPQSLSADTEAVINPEPGLLIRAFAAGLSDTQLLVQRGFLDLLVTHLPLHTSVLQEKVRDSDKDLLVTAAASVVGRKDMSLNRRLWAWFLGPDPTADTDFEATKSPELNGKQSEKDPGTLHAEYFSRYGLQSLSRSIMTMINNNAVISADRARPFRTSLSLMDRWEIGGLIIPETFIPALKSAFKYSKTASNEDFDEVLRSASNYFDGVESGLIWGKIMDLIASAVGQAALGEDSCVEKLELASFIITKFNIREEEMLTEHIPLVTLALLVLLNDNFQREGQESNLRVLLTSLSILDHLLHSIPQRAFMSEPTTSKSRARRKTTANDRNGILRSIRTFYDKTSTNPDAVAAPFTPKQLADKILSETASLFTLALRHIKSQTACELTTKLLSAAINRLPDLQPLRDVRLLEACHEALNGPRSGFEEHATDFPTVLAIASIVVSLQTAHTSNPFLSASELTELSPSLIHAIWYHLSPFRLKYHVEAVRCLWQLQAITAADRRVEAAITSFMVGASERITGPPTTDDIARRFSVLWTLTVYEHGLQSEKRGRKMTRKSSGLPGVDVNSAAANYQTVLTRPLFILLDCLADDDTALSVFIRGWLQDLPSLNRILDIVVDNLTRLDVLQRARRSTKSFSKNSQKDFQSIDDTPQCLYYMQHILNILKWPSDHIWAVFASDTVPDPESSAEESQITFQAYTMRICLQSLQISLDATNRCNEAVFFNLRRTALSIIKQLLCSPYSESLRDMEVEESLIEYLHVNLTDLDPVLQTALLDAVLAALRLRHTRQPDPEPQLLAPAKPQRESSLTGKSPRIGTVPDPVPEKEEVAHVAAPPPPKLLDCLQAGLSAPNGREVLDSWIAFLGEVLPLYAESIFQNLLPLVGCFCEQIGNVFNHLKTTFREQIQRDNTATEPALISLMHGLEQILALAHDRLVFEEVKLKPNRSPEQPQGFFGNMVSGVFTTEAPQARAATANDRMTVLLCFQDTLRICFSIWSWTSHGFDISKPDPTSLASFTYTSLRTKNRARRILEHLFAAESLECLETLAVMWCHAAPDSPQARMIINVLNVLDGSRPKNTIPAIFNAIYSRASPHALDQNKTSTLTSDLAEADLVPFLIDYTRSLEDDAMDEIWPDCMTFVRDVLANPLPYRQILSSLLAFIAMLAEKVDNTNFGEQKKMRRELGELFVKLLTATFTTRSMAYLQEPNVTVSEHAQRPLDSEAAPTSNQRVQQSTDVVSILAEVVPKLGLVLGDNDRVASASATISANVVSNVIRSKNFPSNVTTPFLDLLQGLTKVSHASKTWKKDLAEVFNDSKFFTIPLGQVHSYWLPILRQWTLADKDRMPELIARLSAPSSAGIVFGVGASSARLEADRKTQLTLRRMALLTLAASEDTFVPNARNIEEKLAELFTATTQSSPSAATLAEVFLLLRVLVIQVHPTGLAPFWPIINTELRAALSSILPDSDESLRSRYNNHSLLQACKLLDTLVVTAPDDFQLNEWLFITDTIDAVYRHDATHMNEASITDKVIDSLGSRLDTPTVAGRAFSNVLQTSASRSTRRSFLDSFLHAKGAHSRNSSLELSTQNGTPSLTGGQVQDDTFDVTTLSSQELLQKVVHPFFAQLSIAAYEATYARSKVDIEGIRRGLLVDIFDTSSLLE